MSNYDYEDDDDFTTNEASGNDLVKQLRKAAKQKDKELAELRSQFEGLSKAQRERSIKDALERRGVNRRSLHLSHRTLTQLRSLCLSGLRIMPMYSV
jgi:hypothetical protein